MGGPIRNVLGRVLIIFPVSNEPGAELEEEEWERVTWPREFADGSIEAK